jgi:5-methylcytosine-specific restriction endonuclease McrA
MSTLNKIILPGNCKTQKELKEYTKNIISTIGLCESIKTKHPDYYDFFIELFKRHPKHDEKVKDLVDIKIRNNKQFKKQLEVYIEKSNGDIIDISVLNKCIRGRNDKNDLNTAMRDSIKPQLSDFRKTCIYSCVLCGATKDLDVDHHKPLFCELYGNFISNRKDVPIVFDDNKSNVKCFRKEDVQFQIEWNNYHKTNAVLRMLCKVCNNKKENKVKTITNTNDEIE